MSDTLLQHQQLCDDIHACVLEENRLLRQHERAPDAAFLGRKRQLLERLDASLTMLHTIPAGSIRTAAERSLLEQTRGRILQILQLDKENEQLLLRVSVGNTRVTPRPAASVALLQKIYARAT